MKKKTKALLVLGSMLLGAFTLASCNVDQIASSSTKQEDVSSSKPVESTTTSTVVNSTTPSSTTPSSQNTEPTTSSIVETPSSTETSTTVLPEYVGFKVYLNGEEFSSTNNKLEYNYGDDYLSNIQVKLVKRDGTLVDYDDFTLNTEIVSTVMPGTYTASIPYGDEAVTITVVIKKLNLEATSFEIESKTCDGEPAQVSYELSAQSTAKLYYKVKGADDSTYTETAPTNPGEYVCKLVVEESAIYNAYETTKEFTIGEEVKALKVYIDDVEYSSTNNTIEFNYGDEYNIKKHLTVKEVGTVTGTETTITDFSVDTELVATSNAGTYTASVKYGNYEATSLSIVINKIDSKINSFEAVSKIYDTKEVVVNYKTNNDDKVKLYYKAKGADDSTYTEEAPKNAGYYVCKLVLEEDANHNNSESGTCEFYIAKKPINVPLSEWDERKIITFSNGSEQKLDITNFDSSVMTIYGKDSNNHFTTEITEVKNTLGIFDFTIKLNDDNLYFANYIGDVKELYYVWNIIDSSIITSVSYDGNNITFAEFLAMDYYMPVLCSFTTIDGYSAYLANYNGNQENNFSESEYREFVIKEGDERLCRLKLPVGSTCIDGVVINGESFNIAENLYYYVKDTDENIEVEFVNPISSCYYSSDETVRFTKAPTDKLVLAKGNHDITLYKQNTSGSYMTICHIFIVFENPIKQLNVIRYSVGKDQIFLETISLNSSGYYETNSDNDFAIGLDVELKDEYKDCTVRISNRDSGEAADFVQFWQNNYNGNNYSVWSYILLEILKGDKVIYSNQVTLKNDFLQLEGGVDDIDNRGMNESALLVNNSERKADFKLVGQDANGTLLVNGEEVVSKTYGADGIYREKITYIKEVYGQVFSVEFYLNVIVSEDSKDFGTISCTYKETESGSNYGANINQYNYSNVFSGTFNLYSVNNFDTSSVKTDKNGYSVTSAQLVNDDDYGITYMIVTVNDGTSDHTLYLLVETNASLGSSLDITGNTFNFYSNAFGPLKKKFDENNTLYLTDVASGDYFNIEFVSYLDIKVTYPSGEVKNYGFDDSLSYFILSTPGTYTIDVKNRFNQSRTYTIEVDEFSDLIDITVGEAELYYRSAKDSNFKIDSDNQTLIAYVGDGSESLVKDDKVELSFNGLITYSAYYDKNYKNKIVDENITLDVLKDDKDNYYAVIYCLVYSRTMNIKLIFAEEPRSPLYITVGEDVYDLGSEDSNGDFTAGPIGGLMLIIDSLDSDIYIKGTKVYDDYSYSLILFPYGYTNYSASTTLASLEHYGFLTRIYDEDKLTAISKFRVGTLATGLVVPYGTPNDAVLGDILSSEDDMFMIIKSNYAFELAIGESKLYASMYIPDLMTMMMGGAEFKTNADISEKDNNGKFTELTYYIGKDELDNITTNNTYVIDFNSVFGEVLDSITLAADPTYELKYFFTDSAHNNNLAIKNDKIELSVQEYTSGTKYVEFYYDLQDAMFGSAKVTIVFDDYIAIV